MELEEEPKSISDHLQILHRRKYTILATIPIVFVIAVIVALALPPIYRSASTILIEQQKIPVDLVKSTVMSPVDERIKQINQAIMTVDNINKIIEKYQLYPTGKANPLDLAEKFKANFTFELVDVDIIGTRRNSKLTLAFKLAFEHKNPILAQKTASEMTNMFLNENIKSRINGAIQSSKFLEEEAEKFRVYIQNAETKIAEYKNQHRDSLPELLSSHLDEMGRLKALLQQTTFQEQVINDQRTSLQAQLASISPTNPVALDNSGKSVVAENLPSLQAEYKRLLTKYSVLHPDVIAIKRKIDNYKEPENTTNIAKNTPNTISNPMYVQLKNQLDMADIQQRNLIKQKESLIAELKKTQDQISQTSQVELEYADLMRDLDSNKQKYKELKEKYLQAKLSQALEEEQKSEKFSVIEPAVVPTKPEKPDRLKILLGGIAASIVLGLVVGVGADILGSGLRGQQSIKFHTQMQPLVVIPYVKNQADMDIENRKKTWLILLCVCSFCITVIAVHTLYMPLNALASKVMIKTQRR